MKARVIHIKQTSSSWKDNPDYVYIGRAGKGLSGYFGNPHPVGFCSECNETHMRDGAIQAFRIYFNDRILNDEEFKKAVLGLKGKTLVCFCKPAACHGDVFVEYLNGRVG